MIEVPFTYGGRNYTLDVPDNFDILSPDEQRRIGLEQFNLLYPGVYQPPAPVPTGPVDTSFLGAFQYGADQPTERIADTLETFFGMDASGLRGLVPTDPNYRSATTDFINAPEGAFNVLGYAPGYIPRAVAEQGGNLAAALGLRFAGAKIGGGVGGLTGGAVGSIVPGAGTAGGAAIGATTGALIGGLTLPTIFEAMQVAGPVLIERMKNNGKTVADATTEDYVAALTAAGFSGVANTFGLLGIGKIKGMIAEAVTEGSQSAIQQTGETLGTERGLDVSPREVVGEAVLGGATRGSLDATVSTVKAVPKIPGTLQDATDAVRETISDPAQLAVKTRDTVSKVAKRPFASVAEYQNDTAQVESDLRVVDMFNSEKEAIDATESGTAVADDVVFKNVGDKLRRTLTEAVNSLYGANKISNEQRKALLNGPVRRAAQHNREMTAPIDEDVDTEDGRLSGFETDADLIMNLDIDNADKMVLMQGLRDLNTVAENGMKNRKVGFFSKMMERYGSGVGTAAGFTVGGAPGAVAGATAGQVALKNLGQAIDRALGIGTPPVLRRYNARRRASEVLGRDYGNTPQDLAELIQRMLDEQAVINTKDAEKAAQDADPSVQALDDYLNAKGAERAGGWLPSAAQHATSQIQLLDPTATVTQEDVLAALGQLLELGVLGPEVVDPLVVERGGRILIPGLLYRITDAALDYKKEQLGLEPSAQSQAAAAQVKQAVDARQAAIQRGIEDNRRFLDDLNTATEADVEMSRADRAKILEAQSNMRLDLGSNPMQKLQRIIDDLAKSGVPQTYIDKYVMPYAARVAQQQQNRRGGEPTEVNIDAMAVDAPPSPFVPDAPTFDGPTPTVQGQSQQTANKHGLNPHLRVETTVPEDRDKPLFTQKTNNKNAPAQIENIDTILERHPDALESPEAFTAMLADALASDDVPVPPLKLIEDINGEGSFELLDTLTPGQLADANKGFENAAAFRQAYLNGKVTPAQTGKLFLWSFLSRGVSPYAQESMFLDAYDGIDQFIEDAANGTFNLKAYLKWASGIAPAGSGQPGAGSSHNLNAFGKNFLIKMSQDAGLGDGRSRLKVIHDMMSDPESTGKEIRRQFLRMGEGVGIDNKVVSFTLLVAGYPDVMVLDRVQLRNMFNDGRFGDLNLWDGYKVDGKVVTGSSLADISYGARGLLVYEAIEQSLQSRISALYNRLGRPQDGSVGRYHWETWVASSGQEASHETVDAILNEVKGVENPILGIRSKEGEYAAFAYGARYGLDSDGPSFIYSIPDRGTFNFTVPDFQTFLSEIKKPANGVVPRLFEGVKKAGKDGPWYNSEGVDKDALRKEALKYGKEIEEDPSGPEGGDRVRQTDGTDGANQDVSNRPSADQPNAPKQEDQGVLTDFMAVDPAQMEFDLDVQNIPRTSDTEAGAAQRAVKENLDEANALIEIGKPGSKYEDGIKTQEQLEALATALGVMNKLVFVDSFAEMRRVYESMTGGDPRNIVSGMMGVTATGPDGEIMAVLVLKQGKGGKNYKQDKEFLTAVHEVAHVIEGRNVSDSKKNPFYQQKVVRPYKVGEHRMSDFSFRGQLNIYLAELGRDKRVFDNDPIVKEIREIQMNETATQPDGSQVPLRPSLRSEEDFRNIWANYYKNADAAKRARMVSTSDFVKKGMKKQRKIQEDYYENAAEFAVDPIIFALMEPKRAKENYPNVYKFIQDTFAGKKMYSEDDKNTSPVRFYANPFSIILAAVLSAMAMGEEEERRQPPMMPGGALTPQPGALTL